MKRKNNSCYSAEQIVYALAGLSEISDEEETILADVLTILIKNWLIALRGMCISYPHLL